MDYRQTKNRTETHNQQYARLQAAYLSTQDSGLLGKMYVCAEAAAVNYLNKYCRTRNLHLDIPTLSHDSATYVIDKYLKHKSFQVKNISAYIYFGVQKALFGDYHKDVELISYEELHEKIPLSGCRMP